MEKFYKYNNFTMACCNAFCDDPYGDGYCNKTCIPHDWKEQDNKRRCTKCFAYSSILKLEVT